MQAYLMYDVLSNINYSLLLSLHSLAEYDTETKTYSIIRYTSKKQLANTLGIDRSTLDKFLANDGIDKYLTIDNKKKEIRLNNNVRGKKGISYVILTERELNYLLDNKPRLFIRYYLYIKYFCGKSRSKSTDFTANQFLSAIGYSTNSNDTRSKLSEFNSTLEHDGLITIERYTDDKGRSRNRYRLK